MKKTLHILSCAAIAIAALASCAKEQFRENAIPAGEKMQVSLNGQIGDFIPADATKADAASVVRVSWAEDDKVYVYDGTDASIGTLTVAPDPKNASQALLSGTITASTASSTPTKLTLVYVKGATEAPAIDGGKISIDLSNQNGKDVPFVLYATIDYNAQKLEKANEYVPFKFATSVMTVNCTGLQTYEGTKISIDKAEIDGVSTVCELAVTGSGVTVAGASKGKITRTGTSVFTQSDSRGSFKLALAADPAAPAARNILVHQGSKVSGAPFTTATLAGGKSYNTVYQMGEYISNGAGGYSPAVKVTGVTISMEETSILVGGKKTLVATVAPANATNKQITWSSSKPSVATVDENGEVTGVAVGSANIFATTADGNFTAVCLVTVTPPNPLYVEIAAKYDGNNITSLKWYRQNLAITESGNKAWKGSNSSAVKVPGVPGTEKDVIVGDYFQWAASYAGYNIKSNPQEKDLLLYTSFENKNCGDANDKFYTNGSTLSKNFLKSNAPYGGSSYTKYTSGSINLETVDDVANIILGDNWRMPTTKEFQAMKGVTYWAWDATDCGYYVYTPANGDEGGLNGKKADNSTPVTGSYNKADALLFFPAAGRGDSASLSGAGSGGRYWSSSLYSSNTSYAYSLLFDSNSNFKSQSSSIRSLGFSVRPVSN